VGLVVGAAVGLGFTGKRENSVRWHTVVVNSDVEALYAVYPSAQVDTASTQLELLVFQRYNVVFCPHAALVRIINRSGGSYSICSLPPATRLNPNRRRDEQSSTCAQIPKLWSAVKPVYTTRFNHKVVLPIPGGT
jgi:hypothetical protein